MTDSVTAAPPPPSTAVSPERRTRTIVVMPAYNAAKAAEIMYARSLAKDLGPFGIRANAVS